MYFIRFYSRGYGLGGDGSGSSLARLNGMHRVTDGTHDVHVAKPIRTKGRSCSAVHAC